jgi:putative chitinase
LSEGNAMSFTITVDHITQLVPGHPDTQALVDAINATMQHYEIDQQKRRVEYFVTQTLFESAEYTHWTENLNYTKPERLVAVWPSRFTMTAGDAKKHLATDYANNPQKLASLVYANRGGNGEVDSGDGWNYRGRGALGLTFRENYAAFSQDHYQDDRIVKNPDLVAEPTDAFASAGWFWNKHDLNALADKDADADNGGFSDVTEKINGSKQTVPQRRVALEKVQKVLA